MNNFAEAHARRDAAELARLAVEAITAIATSTVVVIIIIIITSVIIAISTSSY